MHTTAQHKLENIFKNKVSYTFQESTFLVNDRNDVSNIGDELQFTQSRLL